MSQSEAADPEREIEDLFNAEVFGVDTSEPPAPPLLPTEAPEPKPIEEVVVDPDVPEETPAEEAPEGTPEGTPEEPEQAPDSEETPFEQGNLEVQDGTEGEPEEAEYLAWAKKQYGDDLDPDKLARAAYEKEKLLGKQAEQSRRLTEEREARELQERIDALNTVGILTPDEEQWVDEAVMSDDPGDYAYEALQAQRPELYAAIMDRWSTLGEREARAARLVHSRVLQAVAAPQPSEQESYALALGQTFSSLGLSIETHGPVILQKAEQLGSDHPAVQGMMSPDEDVRKISTRAIYDLVSTSNATVARVRQDDVVNARVQEEQLRQQAAAVTTGGTRVEQPKKSSFWDEFDAELAERGWDGERPAYGRE